MAKDQKITTMAQKTETDVTATKDVLAEYQDASRYVIFILSNELTHTFEHPVQPTVENC